MFVRSQPRLQKLDLSINTETLCSQPDCSMTSDLSRKFMRKPDTAVHRDSSRQKRNHCEVKAFAGFFSPNNQQLTNMIRDKSNSDLRKLLFRNIPSAETPTSQHDDHNKRLEDKVVNEQTFTGLNRSLYQLKTDRKKLAVDAKEEKENKPAFTSRKSIAEPTEKQLREADQLQFQIEKLKDENAELRLRLALIRKQLTEKTLKKQLSSEQLQQQYKKTSVKIKELTDELASLKLKCVRLEAEARTKQEVIAYMERTMKTLNEKIQEFFTRQKALQSRLDTADRALKDVQQQIQKSHKERENISCRLWTAQQKNAQMDSMKYQMKRYGNVILINKQLRQLNQQLTRRLQRMNVVRDHELFSLSSEENL